MTETVNFIRTQVRPIATEYIIRLDRELTEPSHFQEEIATIEAAGESDLISIKINSVGGQINTALAIINAMNKSPAFTRCEVVGEACSAATMIFLNGDEKIINPLSSFMIHTASYGYGGKENNVRQYVEHQTKAVEDLLHKIYKGFLTDEEIQSVIDGKDFWFSADEVEKRLGDVVTSQEAEVIEQLKEQYTPDVYAQQVMADLLDDCDRLDLNFTDIISLIQAYYNDSKPMDDLEYELPAFSEPLEGSMTVEELETLKGKVSEPEIVTSNVTTDSKLFVGKGEEEGVYDLLITKDGVIYQTDDSNDIDADSDFTSFMEIVDEFGLIDLKYYAETLDVKFGNTIGKATLAKRLDEKVKEIVVSLNK